MRVDRDYVERVSTDGFAVVEHLLSPERVEQLRTAIASMPEREEVRRKATTTFLVRMNKCQKHS